MNKLEEGDPVTLALEWKMLQETFQTCNTWSKTHKYTLRIFFIT